jgi:KaiC/GvpD/RAD55 family RecA-like ATPase
MTVEPESDRYALDGVVAGTTLESVASGTNLLVVGDDDTGASDLVYRVLARAPRYHEHAILVTTERSTAAVVEAYRSNLADPDDLDHLRVVDGSHSGLERETGALPATQLEAAASPADVTGLGVGVTNHLRSIRSARVRIGVVSLSPVIDRLGAERAFAFAHVLTSRVRNADHLGLFAVDPSRHAAEHVRVLQSLVDGTFTVRTTDDGSRELRGVGAVDAVGEWVAFE